MQLHHDTKRSLLCRYGRLESTKEAITQARVMLSVLHPHKNNCSETATKVVPALQRGLPIMSNVHIDRTIRGRTADECRPPSHCIPPNANSSCRFVCGEAHVESPEAFAATVCSLLVDDSVWAQASAAALEYSKLVCFARTLLCIVLVACS
jgi:hypothetical protein